MAQEEEDIGYTVFIRVPFPRGDFIDPPTANWNATKEAALWQTLNSTPKGAQIDWDNLAETFEASPAFLLQQAAWLYEKQLSHVREHLQVKHTKSVSNATGSGSGSNASPTLPSSTAAAIAVAGSHAMRRGGSSGGGGGSRAPSALSLRAKTSKDFRDTSGPSTPVQARVPYSRTASSNTVTQIQRSPPAASRAPTTTTTSSPRAQRHSAEAERNAARQGSPSPAPNTRSNLSNSSSSSSESLPQASTRLYPRRSRFPQSRSKPKAILSSTIASESDPNTTRPSAVSEEEDDEDDPAFLPFSNPPPPAPTTAATNFSDRNAQDLAATLRRYSRTATRPSTLTNQDSSSQEQPPPAPSGSSSDTFPSPPHSSSAPSISSPSGALRSPTASIHAHQNALGGGAVLSPRQKRLQKEAAGSDGTPSMGSSFSDLDDASVTHSAMEEALANQMRQGAKGFSGMGVGSLGVVGRMGGFWKQGSGESSSGGGGGGGSGRGGGNAPPTRGSMGNRSKSEK